MLYRARQALCRTWFELNCSSLRRTLPIEAYDERLTVVTMLRHGDVFMYLLAVKSFCKYVGCYPTVVILDDGSLTKSDREIIVSHIPKARITNFAEVAPARCPKGSCWERLLLVSDLSKDSYVVQVDADTLTVKPIPEVKECIDRNRSFTLLGDGSYPKVEPMINASARARTNPSTEVQAVCERSFDQLQQSGSLKYIRGNAGFVGFAKGSVTRDKIEWFSDLMRSIVKEKWDEWGSEQVASNLVIANCDNSYALEFPKYLSFWAHLHVPYEDAAFIHFIGPHRYSQAFYLKCARKVIPTLDRSEKRNHPKERLAALP